MQKWVDIISDARWKQAPPDKQIAIRDEFFKRYVEPTVVSRGLNVDSLRTEWVTRTDPTLTANVPQPSDAQRTPEIVPDDENADKEATFFDELWQGKSIDLDKLRTEFIARTDATLTANVPQPSDAQRTPEIVPDDENADKEATFLGEFGRGLKRFGAVNVPEMAGGLSQHLIASMAVQPQFDPLSREQVAANVKEATQQGVQSGYTSPKAIPRPRTASEIESFISKSPLYALGESLTINAQERLRQNPSLQSLPGAEWEGWKSIADPAVAGRLLGEGIPTAVIAGGSAALVTYATKNPQAGMLAASTIMYAMEAGGAYNEARDAGLSPEQSANIAHRVGLINAVIEQASVAPLLKSLGLGKQGVKQLKDQVSKDLMSRASFRNIPKSALTQFTVEGMEEVVQEANSIYQMNLKLPQDQQISREEIIARLSESFAGGALAGGGMGLGAGAIGTRNARIKVRQQPAPLKGSRIGGAFSSERRVTPQVDLTEQAADLPIAEPTQSSPEEVAPPSVQEATPVQEQEVETAPVDAIQSAKDRINARREQVEETTTGKPAPVKQATKAQREEGKLLTAELGITPVEAKAIADRVGVKGKATREQAGQVLDILRGMKEERAVAETPVEAVTPVTEPVAPKEAKPVAPPVTPAQESAQGVEPKQAKQEAEAMEMPPTEGLPDYAKGAVIDESMMRRSNEGGSIDSPDPFRGGRWEEETVTIADIADAQGLGTASFTHRGSMTKGPIVINDRGQIIDGMNRTHEAILRGDKTIQAYVFKPATKTADLAPKPADVATPAITSAGQVRSATDKQLDATRATKDKKLLDAVVEEITRRELEAINDPKATKERLRRKWLTDRAVAPMLDAQDIADITVIGKDLLQRGVNNVKEFTDALVKELGEWARVHAQQAWDALQKEAVTSPQLDPKSSKTQIATTTNTYKSVAPHLSGNVLDYGAGLGIGTDALRSAGLNADSYEPFVGRWKGKNPPSYTDASKIPSGLYDSVVSFSVLNVVKPDVRKSIVLDIGRVLRANGVAFITARTRADVGAATYKTPAIEDGGFMIGSAENSRYQKGFTQQELEQYLRETLGDGYIVTRNASLNGASAKVTKNASAQTDIGAAERLRRKWLTDRAVAPQFDMQDLQDLKIIGQDLIRRGIDTLEKMIDAFVSEFGAGVKPYVREVWEEVGTKTISDPYVKLAVADIEAKLGYKIPAIRQTWQAALDDVVANRTYEDWEAIVDSYGLDRDTPFSVKEHVAVEVALAKLYRLQKDVLTDKQNANATGNKVASANKSSAYAENESKIERILLAARTSGRYAGASLGVRRSALDTQTLSIANELRISTIAKGSALTPVEEKDITDTVNKLNEEKLLRDIVDDKAQQDREDLERLRAEETARREAGIAARKKKVATQITGIRKRRSDAIDTINKMMLGNVNMSVGSPDPSMLYQLGIVAKTFIEEGAVTLPEVVARVQDVLPQFSEYDIHRSLNAKKPNEVKVRSELQRNKADLKHEARLLADIKDIELGNVPLKPVKKGVARITPQSILALEKSLKMLNRAIRTSDINGDKKTKALSKILELQEILKNQFHRAHNEAETQSNSLITMRQTIKELKKLLATEQRIAENNGYIRNPETYIPKEKTAPIPPTDEQKRANRRLRATEEELRDMIDSVRKIKNPLDLWAEVGSLIRAVWSSFDVSGTFRQGLTMTSRTIVTNPKRFATAMAYQTMSFFSSASAADVNALNLQMAEMSGALNYGLKVPDLYHNISLNEERFASYFARRIRGLRTVVQASARSMNNYLNFLRIGLFADFMYRYPNATVEELEAYANWINISSGIGNLGNIGTTGGKVLSSIFYAPKFGVSRIQAPYYVGKQVLIAIKQYGVKGALRDKVLREQAKDIASTVAFILAVYGTAAAAGFKIGLDPDESDFLTFSYGNTKVDVLGGWKPLIRSVFRTILYGTNRAGLTGDDSGSQYGDKTPVDMALDFLKYKMSPTWTIPIELYTGEDIVGNKTVWYETILGTMTTLMIQSTLDAYKSGGLKEAVLAGGFEFFGGSSQTYASKDNTRRKKYSEIKSLLRASPVRAELELNKWNREHPNDQILLSRVQASLNKSTGVKPIPKIPRKPYY